MSEDVVLKTLGEATGTLDDPIPVDMLFKKDGKIYMNQSGNGGVAFVSELPTEQKPNTLYVLPFKGEVF